MTTVISPNKKTRVKQDTGIITLAEKTMESPTLHWQYNINVNYPEFACVCA